MPLDSFLQATTVSDATDLIRTVSHEKDVGWRPVGDNDNNLPVINMGSDPAGGLVERITNAIDAILELEWHGRDRPDHLQSPREAVEEWYGLQSGRLDQVTDLRSDEIKALASRVKITLRDSERESRPTVDIRDRGIGLTAAEFSDTILNLQGQRKRGKLFLAGAYGQGGSTALSFSEYAIIVSRSALRDRPVAATIVRFNEGDVEKEKHGRYEYLVDDSTGQPLTFDVSEDEFPTGTLVRHLGMELGKYGNIMTAPVRSLWYLTHHYLFDPVLPYRIEEKRSNKERGSVRTVTGNNRRLTQGEHTEYQREAYQTFRDGNVYLQWWVLDTVGNKPRNRIRNYTLASKPIVATYNGQKQGQLPNTVIKSDLDLPYLERYLVVHISCDGLDPTSRRDLFATTRETLRKTDVLDELRQLVVDTLRGDDELKRLNRDRRDRYFAQEEPDAVENIRKRLVDRVSQVLETSDRGEGPRPKPPGEGRGSDDEPIAVSRPPTLLEIKGLGSRKVYPGRRFLVRFKTDAEPRYFTAPETFVAIVDPPDMGTYTGTTNVKEGHGTAYFQVDEDAQIGQSGKVTLEVRPESSPSIKDTLEIEVAEIPEGGGEGSGRMPTPNVNPRWVNSEDEFWQDRGWDETSVAEVVESQDRIDVYISEENERLDNLLVRAQRRRGNLVDLIKEFYLEHISFYALVYELDSSTVMANGDDLNEELDIDPEIEELEKRRAYRHACETVTGIVESLFDLFAAQATEE